MLVTPPATNLLLVMAKVDMLNLGLSAANLLEASRILTPAEGNNVAARCDSRSEPTESASI